MTVSAKERASLPLWAFAMPEARKYPLYKKQGGKVELSCKRVGSARAYLGKNAELYPRSSVRRAERRILEAQLACRAQHEPLRRRGR